VPRNFFHLFANWVEPQTRGLSPPDPRSLCPLSNWICWNPPPKKKKTFLGMPLHRNSCRQHRTMHFLLRHFYTRLHVSDIITLKVAKMSQLINFLTCTHFKINLLPTSALLQHTWQTLQCFQCLAGCGLYIVNQTMRHIIRPLAGSRYSTFESCIKKGTVHLMYSKTCLSWPPMVLEKVVNISRWSTYTSVPQNR
jgi:hypothetical protein